MTGTPCGPTQPARRPPARRTRLGWQLGFFLLFVFAPVTNLLRYDLTAGHAWLFGLPWRLGLDAFLAGQISATELALNLLLRLFVPILATAGAFLFVAHRWGRVYCGWLCPHFSFVELINGLFRRACGKHSIWDAQAMPPLKPDGTARPAPHVGWWIPALLAAIAGAALWSVVLLTYLLPPEAVYANLWHGTLTANQARFLAIGTLLLSVEFCLARHFFCRFGCAVGLFQSLAWMANRSAMVVGFSRERAIDCSRCPSLAGQGYAACEAECPMRLRPRLAKRKMFACTQCGRCLSACHDVQQSQPLLRWIQGQPARAQEAPVSLTGRKD